MSAISFELDEVKEHFEKLDAKAKEGYQTVSIYDLDRIDWLIEQAERVQDLEKMNTYLRKQRDENKKLREALEFYANSENYQVNVIDQWGPEINIMKDGGNKAHQTLEESK